MTETSNQFEQRNCPICKGAPESNAFISSSRKAEDLPFETLRLHWRGFFKEGVFFTYFRCSSCGILYCPTYFTPSQLQLLYSQMPDNTGGVPMDALEKTQRSYFKELKRFSPLTGSFLEVGPDIGLFTELCATSGKFDTFWLFEPNQSVHETLRKRVGTRTCHIKTEMFDYADIPDASVSAVAMIHLLDHVLNPEKTLISLRKKMRKDGVLAIVTHNEASLLASVTRKRWPPYCLQHPHLFNPQSMTALLKASGFKVLEIKRTVNFFPAGYLLKHGLWAAGLSKLSDRIPGFNGVLLPLKLGNMMTLATPAEEEPKK